MVDAPPVPSPTLRGRARQQAAIDALLARAATGNGGALLIHGARGLGRTALLQYAAAVHERSDRPGFMVLATAGHPDEAGLPYAGLRRLVPLPRPRSTVVDQTRTSRGEQRDSGSVANSGTPPGTRTPGTPAPSSVTPGDRPPCVGRLAVATAALATLATASRRRPVLCCVDDADMLDPESLAALGFIARRLSGQRTALLVTARDPGALPDVPAMRLAPMSVPDSRALARWLLPGAGGAAIDALVAVAGGNPRALVELATGLSPGQLSGPEPVPRELPADSALRRAYGEDLRRLPAAARWLVVVAAADPAAGLDILAVAAMESGVDIAALGAAERRGLLAICGTAVKFPDPLAAILLYESAPLDTRREALRCLAVAAAQVGDHRRAATAMSRAATLAGTPSARARHQLAAARYAWRSGDLPRARLLLRRLPPTGLPSSLAGEQRLLRGEIALRTGDPGAALDSLVAAATGLADQRPDLAVDALLRATEAAWFGGDHRRYPQMAALAAKMESAGDSATRRQRLTYVRGLHELFAGRPREAVPLLRRVVTAGEALGDLVAVMLAAAASLLLADLTGARRLAAEAAGIAEHSGYLSALPLALELRSDAEYGLGRYDAAEASCRAGLRAAAATGQEIYAADHRAMLAVLAAVRGEHDPCRQWLRELTVPAGAGPTSRPVALRQWASALLDLADGRPHDAIDRLLGIGDPVTGDGQVIIQVLAAPWLAEAAAQARSSPARTGRAGDQERAGAVAAVVATHRRWAGRTGGEVPWALAARADALLAPPDDGAAVRLFTEALRRHAATQCDSELAHTELLFGRELRRHRRPRDARQHLRRAHETYTRLSLGFWAEQAARELRAAGERVPCRASTLTAQQLAVARLVAAGATNREVAAELFLSPRTVDHHLRNIFHRLGIRSRVELARVLSSTVHTS